MSIAKWMALGVAAIALASSMTACSGSSGNPRFGGYEDEVQPGYEEQVEQQYVEPDPEPPSESDIRQMTEDLGSDTWSCVLSPTYNEDWHDDVVCRKGAESHRPYLREWDDFVEEWELMESAHEYEVQLNAGG